MAIDTAAKRRSVAGISFFIVGPGVTPDATPDQFWRQSAGWSYCGILASGAAIIQAVPQMVGFLVNMGYLR